MAAVWTCVLALSMKASRKAPPTHPSSPTMLYVKEPYTVLAVVVSVLSFSRALTAISSSSSNWIPLPHVHVARRQVLSGGSGLVASSLFVGNIENRLVHAATDGRRSVESVDSHVIIPVWPSWGGGRVVPISLNHQDPFLLLAHHKHWFDPRDPLRKPFQMAGKALGLPYVGSEGFDMHPHRGFDILTYVLDGSDGFQHRDSLNESTRTYRGGTAQWMRTGSGVLHEEYWETSPKRRTDIELFQLWVNLPASHKMDEPVIQYVGESTDQPWIHDEPMAGVRVRNVGETLDASLFRNSENELTTMASPVVRKRPPVSIQHATLQPGATWNAPAPPNHSATLYVREGTATLPGSSSSPQVKALETASFASDGDCIVIQNSNRQSVVDVLLLTGEPLCESIALGGPIVMNTEQELNDAYRQLQSGTFLNRNVVRRDHKVSLRRQGGDERVRV